MTTFAATASASPPLNTLVHIMIQKFPQKHPTLSKKNSVGKPYFLKKVWGKVWDWPFAPDRTAGGAIL